MQPERHKRPRPPFNAETLERLALFYVGRYATTRTKLRTYLKRKLAERGWDGEGGPPVEHLIERFVKLGYIDDAAFASARSASLKRRGYGERRVAVALRAAGIEEEDALGAREAASEGALRSALRFAERRRIGPYAAEPLDREARAKAFAAMMRAGHSPDLARKVLDCAPGDIPDSDSF